MTAPLTPSEAVKTLCQLANVWAGGDACAAADLLLEAAAGYVAQSGLDSAPFFGAFAASLTACASDHQRPAEDRGRPC